MSDEEVEKDAPAEEGEEVSLTPSPSPTSLILTLAQLA